MADLTDEQREQNRTRQMGRHRRSVAREIAQEHATRLFDQLITSDPPEGFEADQAHVYKAELGRLRERIGGPARRG